MNWTNEKVLIGGGAGMIGSHMARELLKRGARVTVVDNLSSGSRQNIQDIVNDVEFIDADLRVEDNCFKGMLGNKIVFQFAADMGGIGYITKYGAQIMENNTLINLNMLRAAKTCQVENYYFSSSACIYPEYKQTKEKVKPLKESDATPAQPDQFYGWEKLYTEKLAESFQRDYGMNIKIGRFHNIYGEVYTAFDKHKGKAPCHLIMKAIKHPNPEFSLWGDGKATRSYCYINDCIEAVLRLMDTDFHDPINIGSDRLISVDDLAKLIIDISGKNITPTHDLTKPQGVRGRNADLTLVRKVLKWEPQIDLEAGLANVYQWAENHLAELEGI
jgi:nucleoside-diphosphate-sugar epimerase